MPNLDGVSATSCIREIHPLPTGMPIIAMTSNIRSEDIEMYFRWGKFFPLLKLASALVRRLNFILIGMNDVLPKPFTKEGMLRILEKQLQQLKKPFNTRPTQPQVQVQHPQANMSFATPSGSSAPLNLNMNHVSTSLKDEASPGKSPASSWHSPNQIGASPQSQSHVQSQQYGQPMSAGGYNLTPTHAVGMGPGPGAMPGHFQTPTGRPVQHRRVLSEMSEMMNPVEEHPDVKRQRMYPPQQGGFA